MIAGRAAYLTIAITLFGSLAACSEEQAPSPSSSATLPALAYISNQDAQISVIDLETFKQVGTIDSGAGSPRGIGISDDGHWLVSANRDGGSLSIMDRSSGALVRRVAIGENPEFVRVRGQRAFVSFEPAAEAGPPPAPGSPEALALKEKREAEETEPAKIAVVDLDTGKVIRTITGGIETEGIEFSTDGEHILITNEADNSIGVHRIDSGEQVKSIDTTPFGPRPRGIKRAPDGKSYVASLEFGNKLLFLDETYAVTGTLATGKVPYGLSFDLSGKRLFVALAHDNAMQVFDVATRTEIARVPTGKRCWHFTFTPDESHLLVTCGRSHETVVIDANTYKETARLSGQSLPWGIVTWPKSAGTLDWPAESVD